MIFFTKKLVFFCLFLQIVSVTLYSQSLTLDSVVELAITHNKDVQIQQQALVIAQGKLMEQRGNLDFILGAEGSYGLGQNPQDKNDPNYEVTDGVGLSNTTTHDTGGGIFLQKLFGFGLQSKLSYSINHNRQHAHYELSQPIEGFSVPDQDGRNTGSILLELSLPLLKSFNNSLVNLQIETAQSYYHQMVYQLEDTIAQTIVSATKHYLEYCLAEKNLEQLETLAQTLELRYANIEKLVSTGNRSKNELLAVEISMLENQRNLELAKLQLDNARLQLLRTTGVAETQLQGTPELPQLPSQGKEGESTNSDNHETPPLKDLATTAVGTILDKDGKISQDYLREVANKNNKILSLQEALVQAEKNLSSNKIASLPDLNFKVNLGVVGATYSNDFGKVVGAPFLNVKGVNVQGQLSLQAYLGGNTRKGKIQQAQGQYESACLSLEQAMSELEIQLQQMHTALAIYQGNLQRASKVLELQQQLYENEKTRFNAGLITITEVQDQDTQYLQAQRVYNEALVQYMNAIVEMKYYTAELVSID